MSKSRETYNKKEKEQRRSKQKQDKKQKMEERKANKKDGNSLEGMMAYLDENGNLSDTPPDPRKKKVFNQEDIQIGVPKQEDIPDVPRQGTISFYNKAKGFGFIDDPQSGESLFFHVNDILQPVEEGYKVSFMVVKGPRGLNAVQVTKVN